MTVRAVFFDVGKPWSTERYWRAVAEAAGVGPHVVWAALGVTIARNEEHWELWRHLDLERPSGAWESVVYSIDDLYPDTLECLERLRADAESVGVAGNQTAALEAWARSSELPVDVVTGSASLGVRSPTRRSSSGSSTCRHTRSRGRLRRRPGRQRCRAGARRGARLRPPSPRPVGEAPAHPAGSDRDRVARGAPGRVSVRRVTGAGLRIGLGVEPTRSATGCLSSSEA